MHSYNTVPYDHVHPPATTICEKLLALLEQSNYNSAQSMDSETTRSEEIKTSADEESSTTGYVADVSHHATCIATREDDESMDDAKPEPAGDDNTTSLLLLQGTFGIAARPAAASGAAAVSPTAGSKDSGDETKDAKGEGEGQPSSSAAESTATSFVNHGLVAWENNREKWLQRTTGESKTVKYAKPLNVDLIIDAIFSTPQKLRMNGGISEKFPHSVPLPQLVDILQDLWEAESL